MIDCVVIGYGLVGLVCATQLRALGHHVGLAFNAYDTFTDLELRHDPRRARPVA